MNKSSDVYICVYDAVNKTHTNKLNIYIYVEKARNNRRQKKRERKQKQIARPSETSWGQQLRPNSRWPTTISTEVRTVKRAQHPQRFARGYKKRSNTTRCHNDGGTSSCLLCLLLKDQLAAGARSLTTAVASSRALATAVFAGMCLGNCSQAL